MSDIEESTVSQLDRLETVIAKVWLRYGNPIPTDRQMAESILAAGFSCETAEPT